MRRLLTPDDKWNTYVGRGVELWRGSCFIRSGEIEDTTTDSTIMWLRFNGVDGRQLITKADDYDIYEADIQSSPPAFLPATFHLVVSSSSGPAVTV